MENAPAFPDGGVQFDRAELQDDRPAEVVCKGCNQKIVHAYYAAGDKVVCSSCRDAVLRTLSPGGIAPFLKAVVLGVPAAAVGAGIYYGVTALTGYELGLVAIVIGVLVGGAVRRGSGGRGGWPYQALAVGLTYCAIVSTYVPYLIQGARQQAHKVNASPATKDAGAQPGLDAAPNTAASEPSTDADSRSAVIGMLMLVGFVLALPFLAGMQNIMGIVIIGIGLYEAWKINKRPGIQITGPYEVSAGAPRIVA